MEADTRDRDKERALAWLAAVVSTVLLVCVVGAFARPVAIAHFDVKTRADDLAAEVFVPPPQAQAPVAAPREAVAEVAAAAPSAAVPDVVPVAEAVAPLVAPVLPGLAALKSYGDASARPASVPVAFAPGAAGVFPDPPYSRWARQQGMQGKLQLLVDISPSGAITDLKVRETSGHDLLDKHVLDWVKANCSWAPGSHRLYLVPFVFELQ
jgi:TonB family protein